MNPTKLLTISILVLFLLPTAVARTKNGFDLSDAAIPVAEIRRGGVPRDGIPAIDDPKFVSISKADFLKDTDRVIGVFRNGMAKTGRRKTAGPSREYPCGRIC